MKNILLAIRMLLRFRVYTLINLFGLILSLTCALIIARYIHQEYTVDHYCPELDRTFLMTIVKEGDKPSLSGATDKNYDPNFIDPLNNPSVDRISNFIVFEEDFVMVDNKQFVARTIAADSSFLQLLPHPIISGQQTIKSTTDAIITKEMAQKLFGDEEPLGKIITFSTNVMLTVVGVIDNASTKSSIQFDLITSIDQQKYWTRVNYQLVQLHRKEDISAFNKKNEKPMKLRSYLDVPVYYQLWPLKEFYLDTEVVTSDNNAIIRGDVKSLRILSIVALLLLIVGVFNYINLHSVIMLRRAREFGIKKIYGAKGMEIFVQLYLENGMIGMIALFFIWLLIEVTQGLVHNWFNIPVQSNWQFDLVASILLLILLPLITTITPFVRYHYSQAITSLRSINRAGGSVISRTLFMWIQYVITISLVIVAIYFTRQLNCMLNADLNFNHKDIISCKIMNQLDNVAYVSHNHTKTIEKLFADFNLIKQRVSASPTITKFAFGDFPIDIPSDLEFFANDESSHRLLFKYVDCEYMDLYGFKLIEGRLFNEEKDNDCLNLIINEAAKKAFAFEDISRAQLRPRIPLHFSTDKDRDQIPFSQVVGVVENIKVGHLSNGEQPMVYAYSSGSLQDKLMVSIAPGKRAEAITFLEDLFHEINGEGEFTYTFLDDEIAALYKEDARAVKIYVTFAIIAILISCLGLFGLSLYDIRQRYREIALRKINGASQKVITLLLLRKYLYTLLFAAIVASGISYIAIEKYMESYSTRAPLSAWIFVVAILITAFISFCTLWWQIRKAIQINPADVLRGE